MLQHFQERDAVEAGVGERELIERTDGLHDETRARAPGEGRVRRIPLRIHAVDSEPQGLEGQGHMKEMGADVQYPRTG